MISKLYLFYIYANPLFTIYTHHKGSQLNKKKKITLKYVIIYADHSAKYNYILYTQLETRIYETFIIQHEAK